MPSIKKPNCSPFPNVIVDTFMKDLGDAEFKVLVLIARKTFGFHKDVEAMGAAKICRFTGLSKRAVRIATASLAENGYINRESQYDEETKVHGEILYSLAVEEESDPGAGSTPPPGAYFTPPLLAGSTPPLVHNDPPDPTIKSLGTKETNIKKQSKGHPPIPLAHSAQEKQQLADTWNSLVPLAKVRWNPAKDNPLLDKAVKDPEFVAGFQTICLKAQAILASGREAKWITFRSLLGKSKSGQPKWYSMLNGEYDWMLTQNNNERPKSPTLWA